MNLQKALEPEARDLDRAEALDRLGDDEDRDLLVDSLELALRVVELALEPLPGSFGKPTPGIELGTTDASRKPGSTRSGTIASVGASGESGSRSRTNRATGASPHVAAPTRTPPSVRSRQGPRGAPPRTI